MDNLAAFVRGYTRDSLPRIRYAGSIDPLNPEVSQDRDFLQKDDPKPPASVEHHFIPFRVGSPRYAFSRN